MPPYPPVSHEISPQQTSYSSESISNSFVYNVNVEQKFTQIVHYEVNSNKDRSNTNQRQSSKGVYFPDAVMEPVASASSPSGSYLASPSSSLSEENVPSSAVRNLNNYFDSHLEPMDSQTYSYLSYNNLAEDPLPPSTQNQDYFLYNNNQFEDSNEVKSEISENEELLNDLSV